MTHRDNLVRVCEVLSEQENLKVTIHQSTKGALVAGCGALLGGLLGGPIGLAIGGSIGSVTAAFTSKNYKSVVDIIRNDLTPAQKIKLADAISKRLGSIRPEEYAALLSLILTSSTLKEAVLKEIGSFLLKELSCTMVT